MQANSAKKRSEQNSVDRARNNGNGTILNSQLESHSSFSFNKVGARSVNRCASGQRLSDHEILKKLTKRNSMYSQQTPVEPTSPQTIADQEERILEQEHQQAGAFAASNASHSNESVSVSSARFSGTHSKRTLRENDSDESAVSFVLLEETLPTYNSEESD